MMTGQERLMGASDPPPVAIDNPGGGSPFLFLGDHAGAAVPASLANLGLAPAQLERHIALDIGVRDLGQALAAQLDAVFIRQRYSRLVIDCNRDPRRSDAIPARSDGVPVPANAHLRPAARVARVREIHDPYHAAIAWEIARRRAHGRPLAIVCLHSFTPVLAGVVRPWDVGVLHWTGDVSLARHFLEALRGDGRFCVGDNEPYAMDATDYTAPWHACSARIPYVELELRQDLLSAAEGAARWADILGAALLAWPDSLRS